tara:strand:+ start:1252 stop:1464 length:213 start_codon:yes stop_codon:yes gene_type:complete
MTLDEFRKSKNLSYKRLSELVGAKHATVARRWCLPQGHEQRMIPAPNYMEKIMTVTDGAVQPNDFYVRRQ